MKRALLTLLFLVTLVPVAAGEQIYYRRNADGTLELTNVPDAKDLKPMHPEWRPANPGSGLKYKDMIYRTAREAGVHPELAYAVAAVESSFDPRALSPKGAIGLMQLMPDTAERFGVADPFDPADNVKGGVKFLRYLLDLFDGDVRLALAAYNAGENAVLSLGRIPPYQETRVYVSKVIRRFGTGRSPFVEGETPQPPAPPVPAGVTAAAPERPAGR